MTVTLDVIAMCRAEEDLPQQDPKPVAPVLPASSGVLLIHVAPSARLDPSKPEPHVHLANVLEAQDRFDEAVVHYERALALAPQMPEAHNDYGVALAKRGRTAEAIRRLSEAVRLRPEFGDAWLNLGAAYANAGRFAEAVESLERGIRLQPDRPGARELLERVRREAARAGAAGTGR